MKNNQKSLSTLDWLLNPYLLTGVEGLEGESELFTVTIFSESGRVVIATSHGSKNTKFENKLKLNNIFDTFLFIFKFLIQSNLC